MQIKQRNCLLSSWNSILKHFFYTAGPIKKGEMSDEHREIQADTLSGSVVRICIILSSNPFLHFLDN